MMKELKFVKCVCAAVGLLLAAGSQSGRAQGSASHTQTNSPATQPSYTVELIPNPQLTPTSRDGDKPRVVYSENIVAVYVNTNGANAGLTNAPAPTRQDAKKPATQK